MESNTFRFVRGKLAQAGWPPRSRVGRVAFFILGLDVLLFAIDKILSLVRIQHGTSLSGWVSFLTSLASILFCWLLFRFLRDRVLWRLRNRLIVTYVFMGVIPLVLLTILALTTFYLLAGQFATFVVTMGLETELKSLHATNTALAHELAGRLERNDKAEFGALESLRRKEKTWMDRQVCVWRDGKLILNSSAANGPVEAFKLPAFVQPPFASVVRDQDRLYLRAADEVTLRGSKLIVVSSEPLDQHLLADLANNLGEV